MKNTIKFLKVLLVVGFTFTSCDDIEDLADIDFSTSIKATIPVQVNQGQTTLDESVVLSLDNNDTHDYLSKIKDVKIKKLTYRIINFTGDSYGSVDVEFYADNIALDLNEFMVKDAFTTGTIFEVTDVAKLNEMASLLKKNKKVTVGIKGDCEAMEEAMNFKVEVTATLDLTANPL